MGRWLLVVGAIVTLGSLAFGAVSVLRLEGDELEVFSEWAPLTPTQEADETLTPHQELVRAELRQGEDVTFEVCSNDTLDEARWKDAVEFIVWNPLDQEVLVRAPLDEELLGRVRRSSRGACVVVAEGNALNEGGVFAIEAVWANRELPEAAREVPIRGRIIGSKPLQSSDRFPAVGLLLGAILLLSGLGTTKLRADEAERRRDGPLQVVIGVAVFVAAAIAIIFVPFWGATASLGRGLTLAAVQVVAAFLLVRPAENLGRREALGIGQFRWYWLLAAPLVGLVLWRGGGLILELNLFPSTEEAPVETLVSWPSGMLAFALVGVIVPLAEELFFRGFVYGALVKRWGGLAAFLLTTALFVVAHMPQTWGAWGSLVSIAVTGLVLTGLRWASKSTLVPVVAHLTHNAVIILLTLPS